MEKLHQIEVSIDYPLILSRPWWKKWKKIENPFKTWSDDEIAISNQSYCTIVQ